MGAPITGIPRSTLHRILREALPAGSLVIGSEVTGSKKAGPATVRVGYGPIGQGSPIGQGTIPPPHHHHGGS